jgi:hypothetical protein
MTEIPHAFLCYGIEDMALAEKLTLAMQSHGIETLVADAQREGRGRGPDPRAVRASGEARGEWR